MSMPTSDDLRVAADWLDMNEGTGAELDACQRVKDWLIEQAQAKDLREACRGLGVPVAIARKILRAEADST